MNLPRRRESTIRQRQSILLVAAIFAALLTVITGYGEKRAYAQETAFGGLHRRLRLSDSQQSKIQQLYRDSDRRKSENDELLEKLYHDLDKLYDSYDFDRKRVKSLTEQIAEVRQRSLTLYRENEEKIRTILTREQFERLRNITKVQKGQRKKKNDD